MDRRTFLAALASTGLAGPAKGAPPAGKFLASDVGPLRRVLVHDPGPEARKLPLGEEEAGLFTPYFMSEAGMEEHKGFADLLAGQGAEVLRLHDLLDEAILACSEAGRFRKWVRRALPALSGREDEIDASVLVGALDEFVYHKDEEGAPLPLTLPLKCLFFTRDLAVMTPRGLVLANFINRDRAFEPALFRFALQWAPALRKYPLAFDAPEERVYLQGGDLIVKDEQTLFLGVGNLSGELAAARLARTLLMDVLAVQMLPGADRFERLKLAPWNPLRTLLLHLDSTFGLAGERKALLAPYLFESRYAEKAEKMDLAGAFWRALGKPRLDMKGIGQVGRIRRYRAGTGQLDPADDGMKLGDYLRKEGYEIVHVGGPAPAAIDADYLKERAVPELLSQGANVVATGARHVLAYEGNAETIGALKEAGIDVTTFPASGLVRWHGGPHCMTMPLERGAVP